MPTPELQIVSGAESEVAAVGGMLRRYMFESLERSWEGTVEGLSLAMRDGHVNLSVAKLNGVAIGLASWHRVFNVHYCVSGGEVTDMFIEREYRGRGIALALLATIAEQIRLFGGVFLRGRSDAGMQALYSRLATIVPGAECYVSGERFVSLASLSNQSPRAAVRALSTKSSSYRAAAA